MAVNLRKRSRDSMDATTIDLTGEDEDPEVQVVLSRPRGRASNAPSRSRKRPIVVDDSPDVAVAGGGGPASPQERKPKARRPSYVNLVHDGEEDGLLGGANDEDKMVDAVLDVFPDCAVSHCLELIRQHKSIEQVMNQLADGEYPRCKTAKQDDGGVKMSGPSSAGGAASPAPRAGGITPEPRPMMTMEKMAHNLELVTKADEYKSEAEKEDAEPPSANYQALAMAHLIKHFSTISIKNVQKVFKDNKFRFFATKEAIKKIMYGSLLNRPNDAAPIDKKEMDATIKQNCKNAGWHVNSKPRVSQVPHLEDPAFAVELKFSQEYDLMEQEKLDHAMRERMANEAAEIEGNVIECGCCCSDYAFDVLVQCTEGHLFCPGCLRRYAQTRVFEEGRTKLTCMNTTEECQGTFTDNQLIRVLDPKVYQKYQEREADEAIKAAELSDLVTCPACGYKAELEHGLSVFNCPNAGCGKKTCRHCQEEAHPGLRCEEVEKKKDTNARTVIEEAMTAAKVRTCPKAGCKTVFVKETGCNKMICTGCGALSCYLCRTLIPGNVGYKHFCQVPLCQHGTCCNCPLWTNAEEDDLRAIKEAGLKAKEDVVSKSTDEEVMDVDVEQLLQAGMPARPARPPAPAGGMLAGVMAMLNQVAGAHNPQVPPPQPPGHHQAPRAVQRGMPFPYAQAGHRRYVPYGFGQQNPPALPAAPNPPHAPMAGIRVRLAGHPPPPFVNHRQQEFEARQRERQQAQERGVAQFQQRMRQVEQERARRQRALEERARGMAGRR